MREYIKGIVIGALSAVLIVHTISYAANTVRIVIDGKDFIATDADGNRVDPIIVDGTTYLPVRAISNAFGKAVYWDGPNYTVYLGDMKGTLDYPTVEIEDMISINEDAYSTDRLTDNYGHRYGRAITNYAGCCKLEYLLNMQYSKFKATLYISNGMSSDESYYLSIIADGKTIYTSPEMTKTSKPIDIDVNIKGYNDVKIEFNGNSYYGTEDLCLGDAGFYQ